MTHALGRVAVNRGVYLSEYQRPTVAYVPKLTAQAWWNDGGGGGFNQNEGGVASLVHFSAALEAAPFLGSLRRELDAVVVEARRELGEGATAEDQDVGRRKRVERAQRRR